MLSYRVEYEYVGMGAEGRPMPPLKAKNMTPVSLVCWPWQLSQHTYLFAANLDAACAFIRQIGGDTVIRVHQTNTGIIYSSKAQL